MSRKQIVYVGFSFNHHGKYSGYNHIRDYLKYDRVIDCQKAFDRICRIRRSNSLISKLYNRLFGARLWLTEFKLILISFLNPNKYIFHIIYGENVYKYLGYFKRGNEVVLTLHQPTEYFKKVEMSKFCSLRLIDKLIVMSQEMEDYFISRFPEKPIKYIPHGVDTNYFKPLGEKQNQIIMIGNWLRDFNFASLLFTALLNKFPDIKIVVLTNQANHSHFDKAKIKLLSNISDAELLTLYQQSKVLFLPLNRFTANNALLEGASCGCYLIIASDNPTTNYFNDDIMKIYPKDIDVILEKISIQLNAPQSIINGLRQKVVEEYSWETTSRKTMDFLNSKNYC